MAKSCPNPKGYRWLQRGETLKATDIANSARGSTTKFLPVGPYWEGAAVPDDMPFRFLRALYDAAPAMDVDRTKTWQPD